MKRFYIASKLENAAQVKQLAEELKSVGWEHTYDWTVHGSVQKESEKRLAEVAVNGIEGVIKADYTIALLPGGRGTHTELGAAIVGKGWNEESKIIIWAESNEFFLQDEKTCSFYWLPGVIQIVCPFEKLSRYITSL